LVCWSGTACFKSGVSSSWTCSTAVVAADGSRSFGSPASGRPALGTCEPTAQEHRRGDRSLRPD
jgi:hypothetical protein